MSGSLLGYAGMRINPDNGLEELGHPKMMSTPIYYKANSGDALTILEADYEYAIATYKPEISDKWIYTYDYAPDQSWTTYRNDMRDYRKESYTFSESVYFRLCLRKLSGQAFDGSEDISRIISFEAAAQKTDLAKPWIKEEACRVAEKVRKRLVDGCMVFAVMTDTHYVINGTWQDTVHALGLLGKQIPLDGIIHLGDFTDGMVTKEATGYYVKKVLSDLKSFGVPVYPTIGNHDTNYFKKNPGLLSVQEQRDLYLDGKDVRYFVDLPYVRLIFVDSFDPERRLRYGYSEDTIMWLDGALGALPDGKKAMIFSHLPPVTRLQYWAKSLYGEKELAEMLGKHRRSILAWINGHNHADHADCNEGFPVISITNAKCEEFHDYKPGGAITPSRKLGDVTQEAWDVLLVEPDSGNMYFIRFGAGNDKAVIGGNAVWL